MNISKPIISFLIFGLSFIGTVKLLGQSKTKWYKHKVVAGNTLYGISKKYNTAVDEIKKINDLKSNLITLDQELKIYVISSDLGRIVKPNLLSRRTEEPSRSSNIAFDESEMYDPWKKVNENTNETSIDKNAYADRNAYAYNRAEYQYEENSVRVDNDNLFARSGVRSSARSNPMRNYMSDDLYEAREYGASYGSSSGSNSTRTGKYAPTRTGSDNYQDDERSRDNYDQREEYYSSSWEQEVLNQTDPEILDVIDRLDDIVNRSSRSRENRRVSPSEKGRRTFNSYKETRTNPRSRLEENKRYRNSVQDSPEQMKRGGKRPYIYYYRVRKGDNLYSIAQKYGTTVDELMEVNELDSKELRIGKTIMVVRRD